MRGITTPSLREFEMPLETRNVFIDTEFYVKASLDFSSRTFEAFKEICDEGELKHITSTIVIKEVQRKITEQITDAISGVVNFRRKAKSLKNSKDKIIQNLFKEFDQQKTVDDAIAVFDDFIKSSKTKIVDLKKIDANEVMDLYFERKPPFISEKKKNEFRDAFSLLAIRSALKGKDKVYVISADPDHISFCEHNPKFISIDTLSKFLDIYTAHHDKRAAFIKNFLEERVDQIKEEIRSQLEAAGAYNASTWEDADVDHYSILDIKDFEPSIIHLDDQSCQIVFDVDVVYSVTVTGPDFVNGRYDREDDRLYTFDDTTREESGDLEFSVEIELSYEMDDGDFINEEMDINVRGISGGIEFSVEETPEHDYY